MKLTTRLSVGICAAAAATALGTGVAGAATVRHAPGHVAFHPARTSVAVGISAFPAGGKGGGTEATCAKFSTWLQTDVKNLKAAMASGNEGAQDQAIQDLFNDKMDATDAGCVVID